MTDDSAEIHPLPIISAGGQCEQFWHDQGCPLSDVVHPTFPPPPTAWPTLQGAPEDGFGEAVVTCDMPEPYMFQSLDSCQKRFLWTYKKADLAPLPVVGLVLQVGNEEKFPQALGFRVSKQGPCFTALGQDGGDKRLVELELVELVKLMVLLCLILFHLVIASIAEAILMWISAEQAPSLHRVAPKYLKLVTFSNFWPFIC